MAEKSNSFNKQVCELDSFDRAILAIVQQHNQLSHAEIGERVGLSASAVRRRLQSLRDKQVICQDVAILEQNQYGIRLIVSITFAEESISTYDAFDQQMSELPQVLQSYHVAGAEDYVLLVQAPSLAWYEEWSKQQFMANPKIKRYDSKVVWSCKKFQTALAV